MQLTRREILRLAGLAAISTPISGLYDYGTSAERRFFFDLADLPRIKANAVSDLLGPTFETWRAVDPAEQRATIEKVLETRELLFDLSRAMTAIFRESIMLLVTGEERHEELVRRGLDVLEELPAWDYLLDGGTQVLGIMRASKATTCTLLAMEVLGDKLDEPKRSRLLQSVAEKGCTPCALTLRHMDHPEEAVGWGVEEMQRDYYHNIDFSRWPTILGNNNLRAIPTMGLGLGALALEGHDPRAADWLDLAVSSTNTFFGLFEDDGSYFEGISYVDFSFRTLFMFLEAHYRTRGDIDWVSQANFRGITEYIVCLQNGRKENGTPDIINISDARDSIFPCVASWIAKRNRDPIAQYAANHQSNPGFYADFLLYDSTLPESTPPDNLLNKRFDLEWIVSRTGWNPDDTVVGFRSGPPMNHEHADRNSIMVKAFGERLLTDPFGASYDPRQPHWLLRQTEAHNAVLIDGQGHQYHNGEEGTNASQASASIVAYNDGGDVLTFSSDATVAYKLVRPDVKRVIRSVMYDKRGLLVLVDRLEMDETSSASLSLRLHPDNRDGLARFDLGDDGSFEIRRRESVMTGRCAGAASITTAMGILDLPEEHGVFPFVEIAAAPASSATIITALAIHRAGDDHARVPEVSREGDAWRVVVEDLSVAILEADELPMFKLS